MNPIIEVDNLYVDFDNVTAVAGVSFSVERGHIFGLVGPNGAGKTTLLRVLATLQEPTLGKVSITGIPLSDHAEPIRRKIGFMPDFPPVYEELKVWEFLDLYAAAYDVPRETRRARCTRELERVSLMEKREALVGELSRGMKQRLTLAKTLIYDPPILLLDEPASGLDPLARKQLYDILLDLRQEGRTVMISSHILSEMDKFCTAMGIMEKGKMVSAGKLSEINQEQGKRRVRVRLLEEDGVQQKMHKKFPGVKSTTLEHDRSWTVVLSGDDRTLAAYNKHLVTEGLEVCEFTPLKVSMEDILIQSGATHVS
jgi:ABC-2 type transport system ATP-binding protein